MALTIGQNFPLAQALGDGRLAMADPAAVPAGKYGKAALESLACGRRSPTRLRRRRTCGRRCWSRAAKHRSASSIRPTQWPTRTSDRRDLPGIEPSTIIYPIAILASSTNGVAPVYVQYLLSPKAEPFFEKQGFVVIGFAAGAGVKRGGHRSRSHPPGSSGVDQAADL